MRRLATLGAVIALSVAAAACGSSNNSSPQSHATGTLTIDNESGGTWACQFNPFNLSYISYSLGNVYEPLMFVNTLQSGKQSPWLATRPGGAAGTSQIRSTTGTGW